MASFKLLYRDGSIAKNTRVTISIDNGGVVSGIIDTRGYVSISTSGMYGKIIVNSKTVHQGNLNIGEIIIS